MKAVILVGGKATRLLPLTVNTPKAMVPVVNVPFLEHVISRLVAHGTDEIILAQGHLAGPIESYLGDGSQFGVKIRYSMEDKPLGTAGAIKQAERYIYGTFAVLNGDIFDDLDITKMLTFHRNMKAVATIALTPVEDPTAYGLVEREADGRVSRFLEKPSRDQITTSMINAGTYVLEPDVLKRIPADTNVSIERVVFPGLLADGMPVYAFASGGYWIDMGTPEKYLQLHRDLLSGRCPGYKMPEGSKVIGKDCVVDESAELVAPLILGPGCQVKARAKILGPAAIEANATLEEGCIVNGSVLWRNAHLQKGARISNSILGDNCNLGPECIVEDAIVGDNVVVRKGVRVEPGTRIEPGTTVV